MEVLAASASIGQIIDLTFKTARYLKDVKGAPKVRKQLTVEVTSLMPLLTNLHFQAEEVKATEPRFHDIRSLATIDGPISQFKNVMEDLARKLQPAGTLKSAGQALIWTLEKKETDDMLAKIDRFKTHILLLQQTDHMFVNRRVNPIFGAYLLIPRTLSRRIDKRVVEVASNVVKIQDGISTMQLGEQDSNLCVIGRASR